MKHQSITSLASKLGNPKITEGSQEYIFLCPFCASNGHTADTKGHLYVNPDKKKWICFRCSEKGSLESLMGRLGIKVSNEPVLTEDRDLFKELMEGFKNPTKPQSVAVEYPCEDPRPVIPGTHAFRYMSLVRGYTYEEIEPYRLVYGIHRFLYQGEMVSETERIYFPVISPIDNETLVYWVGRRMNEGPRKYVNPPVPKTTLFNLNQAKRFNQIIICEGVLSALAAGPNAVAILGKTITPAQYESLFSYDFDEYIVSLDGGVEKEVDSIVSLILSKNKKVSVVNLPDGEDPDSIRRNYREFLESRERMTPDKLAFRGLI